MKIQLITDRGTAREVNVSGNLVLECHTIAEPRSFDDYNINIIDLQSEYLWRNGASDVNRIDEIGDFLSLGTILYSTKSSKTIVIFPQNIVMKYGYSTYKKDYLHRRTLKDMLTTLMTIIMPYLLTKTIDKQVLSFEKCRNKLNGNEYNSDFHFRNVDKGMIKTTSECSEKTTTIQFADRIFITTINFLPNGIYDFLKEIKLIDTKEVYPAWLQKYSFFDDDDQKKKINDNMAIIDERNKENGIIQEKINENLNYKSILIETGENLANVIFVMLEKMLDYDLSNFVDIKKEDFSIQMKSGITFIGEIKGVNSNVREANVSQVNLSASRYKDKLDDDGVSETVYPLLIINTFRSKDIEERKKDKVNDEVVECADKYKILIITTETFLKLFEKFLKEEITTDEIISVFTDNTGLLTTDHF